MTAHHSDGSRELILGRIRAALTGTAPGVRVPGADAPRVAVPGADASPEEQSLPRDYLTSHTTEGDPAALLDLLHHNLADYRALVHRCTLPQLPAVIAGLLTARGSRTVTHPAGLPADWLSALTAADGTAGTADAAAAPDRVPAAATVLLPDDGTLTAARLDAVDSVLTGCALAIAETGTVVLDAGPTQGRRLLTLVPDHHICVVLAPEQVVPSVPLALPRLDPARPQTWISGPSATSDIELDRVEGVHGPRTLEVVLVTPA
ncbi:lactate utilization protein C [Kitasatospora sp. NPDC058170]|uniref:LutC/YkgG family protein n=1 Tax=Kitasatospora sp. NPDC058170 TaxID=3346364 RepID=UPI0036DC37FC